MAVYAITLAFANSEIIEKSISAFHATRNQALPLGGHFVVDQHYPLGREAVKKTLDGLTDRCTVLDPGRNLGLHAGFNWAIAQINPQPEDIIIGYDSDSLPVSQGWDMALVRAIDCRRSDGQGEVVWATLANPRTLHDVQTRGFDRALADGFIRLMLTRTAVTNSICAWRYQWLKDVGFLQEPTAFYGHLETTMFAKLRRGKRWAVVEDWAESDELRWIHDRSYIVYKWMHAHTKEWSGDFASYVEAGCPEPALAATPAELP